MGYKLDFSRIIKDHIKTIINDNTGKPDGRDWFFFVLLPIIVSTFLVRYRIFLDSNYINAIISGLSIYVGLSLNLVVLLFEIVQKENTTDLKLSFAKDVIANISFTVILSILTIVFSLLTQIDINHYYKCITNWITYFLVSEMLISVLLLVRNMYFQMLDQIKK